MIWIWYHFFCGVLGFIVEVAFARFTGSRKQDRKCLLFLPLCPVYGLGGMLLFALPEYILSRVWLLLPAAALLSTAVEYAMSLFYEKLWRVSFWNYAHIRYNLHGRVCLPFSLAWSLLSLPLVFVVRPLLDSLIPLLPEDLLVLLTAAFAADSILTGLLLRRTRDTNILKWYA